MYGIWCISTKGWVGEHATDHDLRDDVIWVPQTHPSKMRAYGDLRSFTVDAKDRARYEIKPYRKLPPVAGIQEIPSHIYYARQDTDMMKTEHFKTRATKDGDGGYLLSYGKGANKLTTNCTKSEEGWATDSPFGYASKKRDVVAQWDKWAKENYKEKPEPWRGPLRISPPEAKPGGPPAFKRTSAPAPGSDQPSHPGFQLSQALQLRSENPYICDPCDETFWPGENLGHVTTLGILDEVFNWMEANIPFSSRKDYPWVRVTAMLQHRLPESEKYKEQE